MSNDYNENELDDEFVIEYHNNESVLANIAWQEFKRVCLKYIDIYADNSIKHFLKSMMIDGIKEIRKEDPESVTDMNIDATVLLLLISATNEVINTGLLENHDAAYMSDFINKCTQEQIKKGYRRIIQKEQSKVHDKNNIKAICENCGKLIFQNYTLCEKCLKKKKAWATFGVIVAFLLFNFTFSYVSYQVAIIFNLNSYFSLGSLFWCLLLPYLIKKTRAKVDEKYKLKESDKSPIAQPQAPAPTPASPIPPDIKFPKYTEEQTKDDERDKLLKRISDLYRENEELKKRKPKKAFVAVIVVSLVFVVASIIGMVYMLDQTFVEQYKVKELQKAENIYSEYVVFVTTDNFYHKASCIIIRDSWDSYEAYTRSSVNNSNFQPCPSCFEEKYN